MTVLSRNRNTEVIYLLRSHYGAIYSRLERLLQGDLAIFAQPDQQSTETRWIHPQGGQAKAFGFLNEADKDWVSEELETVKGRILEILQEDAELSGIGAELFQVPGEEDIWLLDQGISRQVLLTKWACAPADNPNAINPLSRVIARERRDYEQVSVKVVYSDGYPFIKESVLVNYKGRELPHQTSEEGALNLGKAKAGQEIRVAAFAETEQAESKSFLVEAGKADYQVEFPFRKDIPVRVINQEKEYMPAFDLEIEYRGERKIYTTDQEGNFVIPAVELSKEALQARIPGDAESSQSFDLNRETELLTYGLFQQKYAQVEIQVHDEQDRPVADYEVIVSKQGQSGSHFSNPLGKIPLGDQEEEVVLEVTDHRNPANKITHTVKRGENIIKLKVNVLAKVLLIDRKDRPIPEAQLAFASPHTQAKGNTDKKGQYFLNVLDLDHEERIKVGINVKRKNRKKNKYKNYKRKITYQVDQNEYIIKLVSRWWPWLLLLIPLLLLLLIRWEKELYVQTVYAETQQINEDTPVSTHHQEAFLYNEGSFFDYVEKDTFKISDANGVVQVKPLRYSVYSWLFNCRSKFVAVAEDNCYGQDSIVKSYHSIKDGDTLAIGMHLKTVDLTLPIVNRLDGTPLPNAEVSIVARINDREYRDTTMSDAEGMVTFTGVPACGLIEEVKGALDGFYPDFKNDVPVSQIIRSGKDPTLRLEPIYKPCSERQYQDEDFGRYASNNVFTMEHDMGRQQGRFKFTYFTDTQADHIKITNGGKVIFDRNFATGTATLETTLSFTDPIVIVEVYTRSNWWYVVHCPD